MNSEFQQVCEAYRARLAGKQAGWCQLHPSQDEQRWSAQQVAAHLVLTLCGTRQALEARLEKGRPTRAQATLPQWVRRFTTLKLHWIPRGIPAPPFARPALLDWPPMDGKQLSDRLRQELQSLDRVLDRCAAQFGRQAAGSHFLLGPLSADQWRHFHALHCRHHLAQLDRNLALLGAHPSPPEPIAAK